MCVLQTTMEMVAMLGSYIPLEGNYGNGSHAWQLHTPRGQLWNW